VRSTAWAIPIEYRKLMMSAKVGEAMGRDGLLADLVRIQYQRNDVSFEQGTFRVRGDTVEIFPAYSEQALRVEFWGDVIERITKVHPITGEPLTTLDRCAVYPATHFVTERATIERAVKAIRAELSERLAVLRGAGKLLEAQRLESRTTFDVEMMLEVGTCAGIENYSRHLTGRREGDRPACLLDYFPPEFLRRGGRVTRLAAPDRRHVQRRPGPKANAGRVRLPSAFGARQPAADIRRIHDPRAPDDLALGDSG
jgi:excinuclease ABC subunit B